MRLLHKCFIQITRRKRGRGERKKKRKMPLDYLVICEAFRKKEKGREKPGFRSKSSSRSSIN